MRSDREWLAYSIELARNAPPSSSAFGVGAVLVDEDGAVLAQGWSRETGPHEHAEEVMLSRVPDRHVPPTATLYTSLEPCGQRASKSLPCAALVRSAGIQRVVFAWREPSTFVRDAQGADQLAAAGVEVIELSELSPLARSVGLPLGLVEAALDTYDDL